MNMKHYVIAIAMVLALGMSADAAAQKHRHTPRTEQVDTNRQDKPDAIEAYSDTTSTDTTSYSSSSYGSNSGSSVSWQQSDSLSEEDVKVLREVFGGFGGIFGSGIALGMVALVCFFVLLPLLIIIAIIAIFYFVNKNRRERYKLAQMAIQNGQPIPEEILKQQAQTVSDDYQAGIRQMCLGVGLAILLGFMIEEIGVGIGALVFFIGLGKWYIARQNRSNGSTPFGDSGNNSSNNNSNIQNYD